MEYESWFRDSPHCWAQASLPLAYAVACAEVVCRSSEKARRLYNRIVEAWSDPRAEAIRYWTSDVPVRGKSTLSVVDSLLRNLDDFVPASEAAENPDLALGDAEMLCQ
jgi:hypothetical protein